MALLNDLIQEAVDDGYLDDNAEPKVCQDLIIKALAVSSLSRNVTIKGGVVMRNITGDSRRATQDIDLDFIRYSLSDESIAIFMKKLNCLEGFTIEQVGTPTELKQQDYHGKRVYIRITDESGDAIESKMDIGVHKNISIEQEEYCFDMYHDEDGASLLINSKEQIFTEKLRSLLIFANNSTRYKDIFDMCYLTDHTDKAKLRNCFDTLIFSDPGMKEKSTADILKRMKRAFEDENYLTRLSQSKQNWLGVNGKDAAARIERFIEELNIL